MKRTEFSQLMQLAREKQEPEDRINFKGSRVQQHRPCVAKAQEESWHGSKESQNKGGCFTHANRQIRMHADSALTCGNCRNASPPSRASICIPITRIEVMAALHVESHQVPERFHLGFLAAQKDVLHYLYSCNWYM